MKRMLVLFLCLVLFTACTSTDEREPLPGPLEDEIFLPEISEKLNYLYATEPDVNDQRTYLFFQPDGLYVRYKEGVMTCQLGAWKVAWDNGEAYAKLTPEYKVTYNASLVQQTEEFSWWASVESQWLYCYTFTRLSDVQEQRYLCSDPDDAYISLLQDEEDLYINCHLIWEDSGLELSDVSTAGAELLSSYVYYDHAKDRPHYGTSSRMYNAYHASLAFRDMLYPSYGHQDDFIGGTSHWSSYEWYEAPDLSQPGDRYRFDRTGRFLYESVEEEYTIGDWWTEGDTLYLSADNIIEDKGRTWWPLEETDRVVESYPITRLEPDNGLLTMRIGDIQLWKIESATPEWDFIKQLDRDHLSLARQRSLETQFSFPSLTSEQWKQKQDFWVSLYDAQAYGEEQGIDWHKLLASKGYTLIRVRGTLGDNAFIYYENSVGEIYSTYFDGSGNELISFPDSAMWYENYMYICDGEPIFSSGSKVYNLSGEVIAEGYCIGADDGLIAVATGEYWTEIPDAQTTYLDKNGNIVLGPYEGVGHPFWNGFAAFQLNGSEKVSYMNAQGEIILYEVDEAVQRADGYEFVHRQLAYRCWRGDYIGTSSGFYDNKGNQVSLWELDSELLLLEQAFVGALEPISYYEVDCVWLGSDRTAYISGDNQEYRWAIHSIIQRYYAGLDVVIMLEDSEGNYKKFGFDASCGVIQDEQIYTVLEWM